MEIYYNMGRFYSFLNLTDDALNFFQLVIELYQSKDLKGYYKKIADEQEKVSDTNFFKQSLYNIMILQKM